MSQLENFILPELRELETTRQSKVLVLAASNLGMTMLPMLYEQLQQIGYCEKLDVVLLGHGGEINATRRIGILLHQYCQHLSFIVPYYCQSSCTLLTLCGHEIIAGELALFSPIDPGLVSSGQLPSGSQDSLSSEDVRLFCEMAENWFDVHDPNPKQQLLTGLMSSIFPATLTGLYRASAEQKLIADELLSLGEHNNADRSDSNVVEQLMHGYHSHHYCLSGDDLAGLGLNVISQQHVEMLSWKISQKLESIMGSRAMQSMDAPLNDVVIATSGGAVIRQKQPNIPSPKWMELTWNQ